MFGGHNFSVAPNAYKLVEFVISQNIFPNRGERNNLVYFFFVLAVVVLGGQTRLTALEDIFMIVQAFPWGLIFLITNHSLILIAFLFIVKSEN
jgi:hypothetical protein